MGVQRDCHGCAQEPHVAADWAQRSTSATSQHPGEAPGVDETAQAVFSTTVFLT